MVEHIHYKMLKNLILHITYSISRLHSSINKRIASLFEMISALRGARQQHPLSMNAGNTLQALPHGTNLSAILKLATDGHWATRS